MSKNKIPNIELRSEEVQELMGKVPPMILHVGTIVILFFLVLILFLGSIVKYPDQLDIPVSVTNTQQAIEVKAAQNGWVMEYSIDEELQEIKRGDTLMVMRTNGNDETTSIVSPQSGVAFACELISEGNYVEAGTPLMIISDSVEHHLIKAKAYVTREVIEKLKDHQVVEMQLYEHNLHGHIIKISEFANPYTGNYAVDMSFNSPLELSRVVIWNVHTTASVRLTDSSILKRFWEGVNVRRRILNQ